MNINLLGIVLAVVGSMVVGTVYYSMAVFGKQWMKLAGVSQSEMRNKKDAWKKYVLVMLGSLVMALVLGFLLKSLQVTNITQALTLSTLVGFGFVATTSLSNTVFAGRPYQLYLIDN